MSEPPSDDLAVYIERLRDRRAVIKRSAARKLAAMGARAAPAQTALVDAMSDPDGTVRVEVARALHALDDPALVPLWISTLSDEDRSVVWVAERALVDHRAESVSALVAELVARTPVGRGKAGLVLGEIGIAAVPALLALCDSEESEVRHRASAALLHIERTAPDGAVADALGSQDGALRRFAAQVLVARASPDAVPAWSGRLSDPDPWIRQTAARALADLAEDAEEAQDALIGALDDSDAAVGVVAARALGALGKGAVIPYLVAAFRAHARLREAVVYALCDIKRGSGGLVQCGPHALVTLMDIVNGDDRNRARVALEALGGLGPDARAAIPALLRALPDLRTRYPAHVALVNIGASAVEPLLGLFAEAPDLRACVAAILGEIGDVRALPALLEELAGGDVDDDARGYIEALGQLGDMRALSAIARHVAAKDARTRQSAVTALGLLGHLSSVGAVGERLYDDNVHVQIAAARALSQIGGDAALVVLIDGLGAAELGPSVRETVADALGAFGPAGRPAVPALSAALADTSRVIWEFISDAWDKPGGDQHYWVRLYAARSLGEIGDVAAIPALARAARATPDDWWVREEIALALGKLGGADAVAALRELADDARDEVRAAARAGLRG